MFVIPLSSAREPGVVVDPWHGGRSVTPVTAKVAEAI
jgi:hypothetical protein